MVYYRVKPEYDNKKRGDGSILVANELYTKKELHRFKIPGAFVEAVIVSRKNIYFFFGARFQEVEP